MTETGSIALIAAPFELEPEQETRAQYCVTTAELAECTCPEFCERDHDID